MFEVCRVSAQVRARSMSNECSHSSTIYVEYLLEYWSRTNQKYNSSTYSSTNLEQIKNKKQSKYSFDTTLALI